MYRGLRGGVQDVAVKVLHAGDESQTKAFRKVCAAADSFTAMGGVAGSASASWTHMQQFETGLQCAAWCPAPRLIGCDPLSCVCCRAGDQHPEVDLLRSQHRAVLWRCAHQPPHARARCVPRLLAAIRQLSAAAAAATARLCANTNTPHPCSPPRPRQDTNLAHSLSVATVASNRPFAEYMEGGDLRAALNDDPEGELRWYNRGQSIALDIARGLHFLHSHDVRSRRGRCVVWSCCHAAAAAMAGLFGQRDLADWSRKVACWTEAWWQCPWPQQAL